MSVVPRMFRSGGRLGLAACLASALAGGGAGAGDLAVEVTDIRAPGGSVRVAVCTPPTFLSQACPYRASGPAEAGTATVVVRGVPPGTYAVQAFHDANENLAIDRNALGLPTEGIGFGNDAAMLFGPPAFAAAAVPVAGPATLTSVSLRYFSVR